MKEIIGAAILIVGLYGGTQILKDIHRAVQGAALEKAAQGLPKLPRFNKRVL